MIKNKAVNRKKSGEFQKYPINKNNAAKKTVVKIIIKKLKFKLANKTPKRKKVME